MNKDTSGQTERAENTKGSVTPNSRLFQDKRFHVTLYFMLYDLFAVSFAYFFALWIRFDCLYSEIPPLYLYRWLRFLPIYGALCLAVFWALRLYQSLWRYASFTELKRATLACLCTSSAHILLMSLILGRMPISYYIMGAGVQFMLVVLIRFAYRFILLERGKRAKALQKGAISRIMLIGSGSAGQMILHDLHSSGDCHERVCCIIDDDRYKWGLSIDGVPIVGGRDSILLNVEKYKIEKIYLAIPSASAEQRRDILGICHETSCELKNLPSIRQLVTSNVTAGDMKTVDMEDLLGREPVQVNTCEIWNLLQDKVVLVTGGGGSIGSELCRQIARNHPRLLVILDIYENNAHAISLELRDAYPELNLEVLIGSVRDSKRLDQVFDKYRPDIVFHAAAHKHVPLMEDSPCESIKNNAIGTYKTAYAAMKYGCRRFVLISTDKAVNPTNIMGASKRLCEMIVQTFDRKIREGKASEMYPIGLHGDDASSLGIPVPPITPPITEYVAVRFGNVLGSNGSVVPRFREQIQRGGPVTVTHPDIIRYFMTIPEAASLVLQAGAYAKGGEIFVLDMGEPVKIDTLARNLILQMGKKPGEDIEIVYTGLRPGEKLYEEKLMSEEGLRTTPNKLIHIGNPVPFAADEFLAQLEDLLHAAYAGDEAGIRDLVARSVSTYHPA